MIFPDPVPVRRGLRVEIQKNFDFGLGSGSEKKKKNGNFGFGFHKIRSKIHQILCILHSLQHTYINNA